MRFFTTMCYAALGLFLAAESAFLALKDKYYVEYFGSWFDHSGAAISAVLLSPLVAYAWTVIARMIRRESDRVTSVFLSAYCVAVAILVTRFMVSVTYPRVVDGSLLGCGPLGAQGNQMHVACGASSFFWIHFLLTAVMTISVLMVQSKRKVARSIGMASAAILSAAVIVASIRI